MPLALQRRGAGGPSDTRHPPCGKRDGQARQPSPNASRVTLPSTVIRCPKCNYDLAGTTTGPCPECGARVDRVALAFALSEARPPLKPRARRLLIIVGTTMCALPLIFVLIPIPCAWYVDRTMPLGAVTSNHPGTLLTGAIWLAWSVCVSVLVPFWIPILAFADLFVYRRHFAPRLLRRLIATWFALIALALCTLLLLYPFWPYAARAWKWWLD
jgi:hypothetical protein